MEVTLETPGRPSRISGVRVPQIGNPCRNKEIGNWLIDYRFLAITFKCCKDVDFRLDFFKRKQHKIYLLELEPRTR